MADSTPLAQRLVSRACESLDAAAIATWDYQDGHGLEGYTEPLAHAVLSAMLRELAVGLPSAWSGLPDHLRALADSIEKGGE